MMAAGVIAWLVYKAHPLREKIQIIHSLDGYSSLPQQSWRCMLWTEMTTYVHRSTGFTDTHTHTPCCKPVTTCEGIYDFQIIDIDIDMDGCPDLPSWDLHWWIVPISKWRRKLASFRIFNGSLLYTREQIVKWSSGFYEPRGITFTFFQFQS